MMPGTFRIRKWLEPPVGLADSPRGACRHCFAMPGVLSAFPYSRFARIPGSDARLMTQSLRSEGISASRTPPSKPLFHPESAQFFRTAHIKTLVPSGLRPVFPDISLKTLVPSGIPPVFPDISLKTLVPSGIRPVFPDIHLRA